MAEVLNRGGVPTNRWSGKEGRLFERGLKGATGPTSSPLDPKSSASAFHGGGQSYPRPSLGAFT